MFQQKHVEISVIRVYISYLFVCENKLIISFITSDKVFFLNFHSRKIKIDV